MNKGICTDGVQKAKDLTASQASDEGWSEIDCVLFCERKLHTTRKIAHNMLHICCQNADG